MIDDDIRALRGALADGPTPGPWYVDHHYPDTIDGHVAISSKDHAAFAQVVWSMSDERALGMPSPRQEATANYIAAASPDRIARMLDEIERLRAEVSVVAREAQTLRNQRDELRIILDKRPAMNDGLREAYAKWSAGVYALDWMDAADIDAARKEGE